MAGISEDGIKALADLFTGGSVGEASAKLAVGGKMGEQGRRFFAARKALGIEGYATQEEAEKQIRQRVIITKG